MIKSNFSIIYFLLIGFIIFSFYMVFLKPKLKVVLIPFIVSMFISFSILTIINVQPRLTSDYDLNEIINVMNSTQLNSKTINGINYDLNKIKEHYQDLYYFYEPLSEQEIEDQFIAIMTYNLKCIDASHQNEDLSLDYVFGFKYKIDGSDQFIDEYLKKLNSNYLQLMEDEKYEELMWNMDVDVSQPQQTFFILMGNEITKIQRNDISKYITNQMGIDDISLLDKEMFVRITKFEIWLASTIQYRVGLDEYPVISFN